MPAFLHNKFIRYGALGLITFIIIVILLNVFVSVFGSIYSTSHFNLQHIAHDETVGVENLAQGKLTPVRGGVDEYYLHEAATSDNYSEPLPPRYPQPNTGYTSGLESYETTNYHLFARTRQFTQLCDTLTNLKADTLIHFKHLTSSLNHCSAEFFVEEERVAGVLAQFAEFKDIEVTRNTQSVTRHKEAIASQADIVTRQLQIVEDTLAEAETAYDEIVAFARTENDAATLSQAIREKLQQIDRLTQRKISLTSQLKNYAQQATDLSERLGVVAINANFRRAYPVNTNRTSRHWETAWETLRDSVTITLTNTTVYLGVFMLYLMQFFLYGLVLLLAVKFVLKLVKKIWRL